MKFTVDVFVTLKRGVMDAEGATVRKSLVLLGYDVADVKKGALYEIAVNAGSEADAVAVVEDACRKLLANPVIQDFEVRVAK